MFGSDFLRKLIINALLRRFQVPRDLIRFAYSRYGRHLALVDDSGNLSYAQLESRALSLAEGLRVLGLRKGDLVVTLLPETREQLEGRLAAYESGLVYCALHQHLPPNIIRHFIDEAAPKLFLYEKKLAGKMVESLRADYPEMKFLEKGVAYEKFIGNYPPKRSREKLSAADVASLHLTSGTTGQPKAIAVAGGVYLNSLRMVLKDMDMGSKRPGPAVHALGVPLTGPGIGLLLPTFLSGAALIIPAEYSPKTLLGIVEKYRVTLMFLTPTALIDWLDYPDLNRFDLTSLHTVIYGSELMPAAKMTEAILRFGPIFQQSYGSFEAIPPLTALTADQHLHNGMPASAEVLSSAGYVAHQVSIRVVDATQRDVPMGTKGEIILQSPNMFKGYWRQPTLSDAVLKNGWLHTGDLGYFDGGQRLHVLGRGADLVRCRGNIVYPREVEEIMHAHPAVKLVVLIQSHDEAVLVVAPRHAYRDETNYLALSTELMAFAAANLPENVVPDEVVIMEALPVSFLNKILRREVRQAMSTVASRNCAG